MKETEGPPKVRSKSAITFPEDDYDDDSDSDDRSDESDEDSSEESDEDDKDKENICHLGRQKIKQL